MKVTFRQSFARDLKKVKDQAVLDRVRKYGVPAAGNAIISRLTPT